MVEPGHGKPHGIAFTARPLNTYHLTMGLRDGIPPFHKASEAKALDVASPRRTWPARTEHKYGASVPGTFLERGVCSCGAWRDRQCMRCLIELSELRSVNERWRGPLDE